MATIADTILQQLGGRKFTLMTGAKNLTGHANALSFKLPSRFAKDGINYVKITLNPSDTYIMEFGKIVKHTYKELITSTGVYCDQMQTVFTDITGLDTHL